jgi:molecular chaperone Hsp33
MSEKTLIFYVKLDLFDLLCYYLIMIKAQILDTTLISHMNSLHTDEMSVFVMADGLFRGALFHGTRFVNQMRSQFNLGILETMVLAQGCIGAALMIPTMKGKEQLQFRYDTNGPAAGFSVEADSTGFVRGHLLQNPIPVDAPLESWDLSPFFGPGTLTITRLSSHSREPQRGTVEIKHKNIAKDLSWYFLQSEQIKTAFNISVQFDSKGTVIGAGGMFLQALPSVGGRRSKQMSDSFFEEKNGVFLPSEHLISKVEHAFSSCPSLGQWYSELGNNDDIIFGLFREFQPTIALVRSVNFNCPCSKDKYLDYIQNLSTAELDDIMNNGPDPLEVICHNCGSKYNISLGELQ